MTNATAHDESAAASELLALRKAAMRAVVASTRENDDPTPSRRNEADRSMLDLAALLPGPWLEPRREG